jgi:chromosome segregation ATPase
MKSEKSFRKNLFGGFNTRDVVNYLAQVSKERREETEALRAGMEKLRRERDELAGGEPVEPVQAPEPAEYTAPADRTELDELQTKLDAVIAERENEREASERFVRERTAFENDRSSMQDALTRCEQEKGALAAERAKWGAERAELMEERQKLLMERDAVIAEAARLKRDMDAASISKERMEREGKEAENIRNETARLVSETRARFNDMSEKSRSSALEIVLELDRMRGFFTKLPDRIAELEGILAQMESDPRPRIRAFVPPRIEET